jgi:hypothetical protein
VCMLLGLWVMQAFQEDSGSLPWFPAAIAYPERAGSHHHWNAVQEPLRHRA